MKRLFFLLLIGVSSQLVADEPVECRFDFDHPFISGFAIQTWEEFSGIEAFTLDGSTYAINYGRNNGMGTVEVLDVTSDPFVVATETMVSQDVLTGGTNELSTIRRVVYQRTGEFKIIGSSAMNLSGSSIGTTWFGTVDNGAVSMSEPVAASLAANGISNAFVDGNSNLQAGVEGNDAFLQADGEDSQLLESPFAVSFVQRVSADSRWLSGMGDGKVKFWDANKDYALKNFVIDIGFNGNNEPDFVRFLEFDSRFSRYVALMDYPRSDGFLETALGLWSLDEANDQCDFVAEFGLGSSFIDADVMGGTIVFGYEHDGSYFVSGTDFQPFELPFSFVALSYNPDQNALYINGGENGLWVYHGIQLGDINQDGVINLLDVAPFIELLTTGQFQTEADLNGDGVVNLLDVGPFVDLLSGG